MKTIYIVMERPKRGGDIVPFWAFPNKQDAIDYRDKLNRKDSFYEYYVEPCYTEDEVQK